MQALKQSIMEKGQGIGTSIVKVDQFLNHRIYSRLMFEMGQAIAERFAEAEPTVILTIEASGIALGLAAAHALDCIPLVFAKKGKAANQSDDMAEAQVHSFTRKHDYTVRADRRYLPAGSRVLIVDDFLADGQAVAGLMSLCEQAGCTVVGVAIAIEKGFQQGGRKLREQGIPLLSLAVVKEIRDGRILLETAE